MSKLQEIEAAIERLPKEEVFALGEWLEKKLAGQWDERLSEDIAAGRLDEIAARVLEEHRSGQSESFPDDAE